MGNKQNVIFNVFLSINAKTEDNLAVVSINFDRIVTYL